MKLGFSELILLFLIALIMLGPTVIPWVQRWLRRSQTRARKQQRLHAQRAAAARRGWAAQMRQLRNAVLAAAAILAGGWILSLFVRTPPVQPQSWQPAAQSGFTGAYDKNALLEDPAVSALELDGYSAPVCVRYREGWLYAAVSGGRIVRLREDGSGVEEVLNAGGEVLGFDFLPDGTLALTRVGDGAQRASALMLAAPDAWNGQMTAQPAATQVEDRALACPTAVCAGPDGKIYFADACGVPAAEQGVQNAYVLALLAHESKGAVYVYDPADGTVRPVLTGLVFAAGLTLDESGETLYVSDAGTGAVWQISSAAQGVEAGRRGSRAVLQNLPGRPAGLAAGGDGRLWVALTAPQAGWLEALAGLPRLRGALMNLPAGTRNRLVCGGGRTAVLAFDADGRILENWQSARLEAVTGICEAPDRVYFAHGAGGALHGKAY